MEFEKRNLLADLLYSLVSFEVSGSVTTHYIQTRSCFSIGQPFDARQGVATQLCHLLRCIHAFSDSLDPCRIHSVPDIFPPKLRLFTETKTSERIGSYCEVR